MAQEIREFAVLVPKGTPKSAPLVTPIGFPERIVTSVSWRVPPGPSGLMGWALTSAGTPVIPIQPNTFVVTDNQADTWQLEGYLDSGNWQVTAYNTGIYDHTVYLTFLLDLPGSVIPPPTPPNTGTGVGVVGTGGTVTPPPPPTQPTPPAADDGAVEAVITAVLAQLLSEQLGASAS